MIEGSNAFSDSLIKNLRSQSGTQSNGEDIKTRVARLVHGIAKGYREAAASNDMGLVKLLNDDLSKNQVQLAEVVAEKTMSGAA